MAEMSGDSVDEGRLDLVPMIDCIMLLLLFFMMTTKFTPEEKAISSLLPTDKGMVANSTPVVTPPKQINILIYPSGFLSGGSERGYDDQLIELTKKSPRSILPSADFRVGNRPGVVSIRIDELSSPDANKTRPVLDKLHAFIANELAAFGESAGADRKAQPPIVIQCFSSLSWQFALVAYDAVRAYEATKQPELKPPYTRAQLQNAREVNFSPPRVRNFKPFELGNELFEILHSQ